LDVICEAAGKVGVKFEEIKKWRQRKVIPRKKPEELKKISDLIEKPEALSLMFHTDVEK
jgi:hypothetical protein